MIFVDILESNCISDTIGTGHLGGITILLGIDQHIEIDVQHVLLGPHLEPVAGAVGAVAAGRSHCQRNLVLVIVVLDV